VLTSDVVGSAAIEGERLDSTLVRSSIARRLGLDAAGTGPADREVARCVDAEDGAIETIPALPASSDAEATAEWIDAALAGSQAVPAPIVQQLGCLLEAARAPAAAA